MPPVSSILLAAGESRRMGTPKALLPWEGTHLLDYQVNSLLEVADTVVVVLGHRYEEIQAQVPAREEVVVAINPNYQLGRATSVRAGAERVEPASEAIVVLNVDQPRPGALLAYLLGEHRSRGCAVTLPVHRGRRGHPPTFSGALLPELRRVRDETAGLRAVVQGHAGEVGEVDIDSSLVLLDLNHPEEYEEARRQWST